MESQRPKFDQEDLRGFEWYYLWDLVHRGHRRTLRGPLKEVRSVAFLRDGKTLAGGYENGVLKLWDPGTGRERATLDPGGGEGFGYLALSPDGTTLAQSWGAGNSITLLDTTTFTEKTKLQGSTGIVRQVAFSPNGALLASGHEIPTGVVKLWDTKTGREVASWKGHTAPIISVLFSPDGKSLATTSEWSDRLLKLWDVNASPPRLLKEWPRASVPAFSPDGKTLAANLSGQVKLWDVGTGKEQATFKGNWGDVYCLAFSPDGKRLAYGTQARSVRVVDLVSRRVDVHPHLTRLSAITFSPDGQTLASASDDGIVELWDATLAGEPVPTLHAHGVVFLLLLPDNRTLATGHVDGLVKLWDLATMQERAKLRGHQKWAGSIACSPDGTVLATGSWDGTVKLWDVGSGQERATLRGHTDSVYTVAYSPDGKSLVSGSKDGTLRAWDPVTHEGRILARETNNELSCVAYSPDGKTLATGLHLGIVRLRDAATGNERLTLQHWTGTVGRITNVAFSPGGKTLAIGENSGTVKLRDAATGQLLASLKGHSTFIISTAIFPDGKTLATTSDEPGLVLWDIATGQQRITLKGHALFAVARNGEFMVTRPGDALTVLLAPAGPEALARKRELDPDDPESPVAKKDAGDKFLAAGRRAEADKMYRDAITRLERLAAHFQDAPVYRSVLSDSYAGQATLLRESKRYSEAAGAYRRAHELLNLPAEPNSNPSRLSPGRDYLPLQWLTMLSAAGRSEEAKAEWQACQQLFPNAAQAGNNLAWMMVRYPDIAPLT